MKKSNIKKNTITVSLVSPLNRKARIIRKQLNHEKIATSFWSGTYLNSKGFIKYCYWNTTCARRTVRSVSSVTQSCPTLCNPMSCSTPGLPVHHQLPESTQTHVHSVCDAIQPHPLPSPSPPALNPSQHQGLFQRVSSLHQVAKVLEFQLQHQSYLWTPWTDL